MDRRRVIAGVGMTLAAAGSAARAAGPVVKARNVVLVHGAFADGSSWAGVVQALQAKDLRVIAVQNPLTSLAADVAATSRAIGMMDGPTVLVGHSYGGVVISQAGIDPKVSSLVYVAALAPDVGEEFGALAAKFPAPPGQGAIRAAAGYAELTPEGFVANFCQDLDPVRARVLAASQGPVEQTLFGQKITAAAWRSKPNWYAVSKQDRMISPEMERFFAQRMNATTVEIDTSHASPVTRPGEIAKLILAAAG